MSNDDIDQSRALDLQPNNPSNQQDSTSKVQHNTDEITHSYDQSASNQSLSKALNLARRQLLDSDQKLKASAHQLEQSNKQLYLLEVQLLEAQGPQNLKTQIDMIQAEAFSNCPDAISVANLTQNKIILVNDACVRHTGYSRADLIGEAPDALNVWVNKTDRQKFVSWLGKKSKFDQFETKLRHKDGEVFDALISGSLIKHQGQDLSITYIKDISELKIVERQLNESNEKFSTMFHENYAPMLLFQSEPLQLININEAAARLLGREVDEVTIENIVVSWKSTEDRNRFARLLSRHRRCQDFETVLQTKAGTELPVSMSASVLKINHKECILAFVQDLTDQVNAEKNRKEAQQHLLQAQKLESLGVLAGGIAHDFNNLLTIVLGNAELALLDTNNEPEVIESLQNIINASSTASALTGQLLAYSGKGSFLVTPLCLSSLVEEISKLFTISTPENVDVTLNLDKSLPKFEGDQSQIHQIIMNLMINASESMEGRPGRISLSITKAPAQVYKLSQFVENKPSNTSQLILEIQDNGVGMDKTTLEKIFEPFFSTKFTGRGLGMAAVLGIIRGHNAAIQVSSELGVGTSFKIYFPIVPPGIYV